MAPGLSRADARAALVALATSLALARAGMAGSAVQIAQMGALLDGMALPAPDDPMHQVYVCARAVWDARLASNEDLFFEAKHALCTSMMAFWSRRSATILNRTEA